MATLYIVGTPIGNLEDVSLRALETLKEVDLILCEDTRVTKRLLERYGIKTPTLSYHQHSKLKKIEYIIQLLREGKNLALVSDAGTPGISDPGGKIIDFAIRQLNDLIVAPIPGPSAIAAAASVAGFPMERFVFMGFPPHKKKRKKFFEEAASSKYPVILYESPHRILKTLNELKDVFQNSDFDFRVAVCRELTKKFETIYRGMAKEVITILEKEGVRGEFIVIIKRI